MHGAKEKRNPGPNFNTSSYIAAHPGAIGSGANPLVHYLTQTLKAAS
jgi:hypothetical protein